MSSKHGHMTYYQGPSWMFTTTNFAHHLGKINTLEIECKRLWAWVVIFNVHINISKVHINNSDAYKRLSHYFVDTSSSKKKLIFLGVVAGGRDWGLNGRFLKRKMCNKKSVNLYHALLLDHSNWGFWWLLGDQKLKVSDVLLFNQNLGFWFFFISDLWNEEFWRLFSEINHTLGFR